VVNPKGLACGETYKPLGKRQGFVESKPPTDNVWPQYDPAKAGVIFFDGNITAETLPDQENLDFAINVLYGTDISVVHKVSD
jgi:hypothetical protein